MGPLHLPQSAQGCGLWELALAPAPHSPAVQVAAPHPLRSLPHKLTSTAASLACRRRLRELLRRNIPSQREQRCRAGQGRVSQMVRQPGHSAAAKQWPGVPALPATCARVPPVRRSTTAAPPSSHMPTQAGQYVKQRVRRREEGSCGSAEQPVPSGFHACLPGLASDQQWRARLEGQGPHGAVQQAHCNCNGSCHAQLRGRKGGAAV